MEQYYGTATHEEDMLEFLSVESPDYVTVIHSRVEDNIIKVLTRISYATFEEAMDLAKDLHSRGYLYDDCHLAYSIRNKRNQISMRDTYQFLDRDTYLTSKKRLGLD